MQLAFTLSMPNRGSWNGGWSGEDRLFCIIRKFDTKTLVTKAQELLQKKSFYYGWSDGWGASVSIKEVTPAEARQLKKKSSGFCGYDWMVDSIIDYGKILATHEIADFLKEEQQTEKAASPMINAFTGENLG